jgi:hypothetical protein
MNSYYHFFREMLKELVAEQQPMTVRQVFYRCVVKGWVEKTEAGYGLIQRDLVKMRWDGWIPFEWIIDASRSTRGGSGGSRGSGSFRNFFNVVHVHYDRADIMHNHPFSIQVWLEKEALAGVIESTCSKWSVPLYCAKGYSSLSFLHAAAMDLEYRDRPAKIFYLADWDPSGQNAMETVYRDLSALAPETAKLGLEMETVAIYEEQIEEMGLPTRPTKKSDTRSANFGDESVELDAIEPNALRELVNDALSGCFEDGEAALARNRELARADREQIRELLKQIKLPDEDDGEDED